MDPFYVYICAAAQEALAQARLDAAPERVGAIIGVGIGGVTTTDQGYRRLYAENRRVDALTLPKVMPSAAASNVSMALGLKGPTFGPCSACASSAHAIVEATHWLRHGAVDAMVAGGVEAPFALGALTAWRGLHIMASDTCRPFSVGRKGLVMGEGAACLVLERLESARARGAQILAVLAGFGVTADAGHIVKPDRDSIIRAVRLALADAGVAPKGVGLNTHVAEEAARLGQPTLPGTITPKSWLGVPILDGIQVTGILSVQNVYHENAFTDADVGLLQTFAASMSIALENPRLYEQARQLAILEERQPLGRELHDSVTQSLYGISLYAQAATGKIDAAQIDQARQYLEDIQNTSQESLADMRLLIFELRPPILDKDGLVSALQNRLISVENRANIKSSIKSNLTERLSPDVEEGLWRHW